jgi:hypothetical protein
VFKKKKEGKMEEAKCQAFFTMSILFLALGIIYMTIGLTNRDKWEKK